MSTFLFILAGFFLTLMVMAKIPGLAAFVNPVVQMIIKMTASTMSGLTEWGVFLFKRLLHAHFTYLKHLLTPSHKLDPMLRIEEDRAREKR